MRLPFCASFLLVNIVKRLEKEVSVLNSRLFVRYSCNILSVKFREWPNIKERKIKRIDLHTWS